MINKKNRILDIRPPRKKAERTFFAEPAAEHITTYPSTSKGRRLKPTFKKAFLGLVTLAVILGVISTVGIIDLKRSAEAALPRIKDDLRTARSALTDLETGKAGYAFRGVKQEIETLQTKADRYGLGAVSSLFASVLPTLKSIPEIFKTAGSLTRSLIELTTSLGDASKNATTWLMHQNGRLLIDRLDHIQGSFDQITKANTELKDEGAVFGYPTSGEMLSANADLYRIGRFLKALTAWLTTPGLKHIAILFENPSEMRPAGGFLGSYGDLTLTADGIQEIKVWDVYDPDGQLDVNYLPPRELRALTPRWGARDANWFFDFSLSAEKTISLLEQSKIYRERGVTFDGALAINTNVLGSLLDIVGPMTLDGYRTPIGKDNFLDEIQREVESGPDNKAGEPKRILKLLAPKLIAAIGELGDEGKRALLVKLREHVDAKDIMMYMRDIEMENYFRDTNSGGTLETLPEGLPGEYLAVVSANIAGGKSDAFLAQHIRLSNKIDADGRISNFLTIERTHGGDKQKESWYQATNKSYLKIFTPRESRLEFMKGGEASPIPTPAPTATQSHYLSDIDLASIEKTMVRVPAFKAEQLEESGKTVFATWMNVSRGATHKLELQYTNPTRITLGGEPIPYLFVFDKQSGSQTSLDALFEAPPGYVWQESGTSVFNYVAETLPSRVSIPLTLVRDLKEAAIQP